MKRFVLALLAIFCIAAPSLAFGGEGVTTMYSPWFDDSIDVPDTPFRYVYYVNTINPNDYDAEFKISYYKPDGTKFANTSSFSHTVPANGVLGFRPSSDLQLGPSETVSGSYVIEVTKGSLIGGSAQVFKAGTNLPDIGVEYDVNDPIFTYVCKLETSTSNHLNIGGFMQYDVNGDIRLPLNVGDYDTFFYINNPSDKFAAEINMFFYDTDGELYECNLDNGEPAPVTYTINPHQTLRISPADLDPPINGSSPSDVNHGLVIVEATKGSVIGFCEMSRCGQGKVIKSYEYFAQPFFGKHMK